MILQFSLLEDTANRNAYLVLPTDTEKNIHSSTVNRLQAGTFWCVPKMEYYTAKKGGMNC